jgi:hypothetical protein
MMPYSPHPPVSDNPLTASALSMRSLLSQVEQYPALPWSLEALEGTEWINVHTFRIVTIGDPSKAVGGYGQLGYRHGDRFVIEHWVRWDVLPPAIQHRWRWAHCKSLEARIAALQADLRALDDKPPRSEEAYQTQRRDLTILLDTTRHELKQASVYSASHVPVSESL